MRSAALALIAFTASISVFGQTAQERLIVRATPGKNNSTIYVADYVGKEYMFDSYLKTPMANSKASRPFFNCRVEVRRGDRWEPIKWNYNGPEPAVMKVKSEGGLPNVCRFALPKETGSIGDCVRIVLRPGWKPKLPEWTSDPFLVETQASSVRSCK